MADEVRELRERLAAVEAERDAERARADEAEAKSEEARETNRRLNRRLSAKFRDGGPVPEGKPHTVDYVRARTRGFHDLSNAQGWVLVRALDAERARADAAEAERDAIRDKVLARDIEILEALGWDMNHAYTLSTLAHHAKSVKARTDAAEAQLAALVEAVKIKRVVRPVPPLEDDTPVDDDPEGTTRSTPSSPRLRNE